MGVVSRFVLKLYHLTEVLLALLALRLEQIPANMVAHLPNKTSISEM